MNRIATRSLFLLLFLFSLQSAYSQDILLSEDFDFVSEPTLPASWQTSGAGWETSSSSSSNGSGSNNLAHSGSSAGATVTPEIDFSAYSSGTISYLARRTSSYSQDSLRIIASVDGGSTFPILIAGPGDALPATTSSYLPIIVRLPASIGNAASVMFQFEAFGGTTGGSNIRIDDLVVIAEADTTMPPPSPATEMTLGFAAPSSSVLESSAVVDIPIRFEATDILQGIQLSASWSSPLLRLIGISRGAFVSDSSAWHLEWELQNDILNVLLLGQNENGLPANIYENLLSFRFEIFELSSIEPDTVAIEILDAIGALMTPGGTDAGLSISTGTHLLEIHPPRAFLFVSTDSLDFGSVSVDSTSMRQFEFSNTAGSRTLVVSGVASTNSIFEVADTVVTLEPDQSAIIPLRFLPTDTRFGIQTGEILLTHDGEGDGNAVIRVSGIGTGGRGDADRDGLVDIGDVVLGIDAAIGRTVLQTSQVASIDRYPFPDGDGGIDVRDLTILIQAIVTGEWPDDILLPSFQTHPNPEALQIISKNAESGDIYFVSKPDGLFDVIVSLDTSLRGMEIEIGHTSTGEVQNFSSASLGANVLFSSYHNDPNHSFRFLLAALDGDAFPPGVHALARVQALSDVAAPVVNYMTGIDSSGERVTLRNGGVRYSTQTNAPTDSPEILQGEPFPNPFLSGSGLALTFPLSMRFTGGTSTLEVFDMLGRRLTRHLLKRDVSVFVWRPEDDGIALSPGLYFARVSNGSQSETRTFTVLRGF